MSDHPAIRTVSLDKIYRARKRDFQAVQDLSLTVERGEIFGLLGPNGAGKTTTIRMLCGLLRPSGGDAWIEGESITVNPQHARRRIGLVPEEAGQHGNLTIAEELNYHGALFGLSTHTVRERSEPMLTRLGLADRIHHRLKTFSRGMKRKVHLVRALLHEPTILLLDEPTAGLDPDVTLSVWDILQDLAEERHVTVILCSHHLEEIQRLCGRIAIIKKKLLAEGTPAGLSGSDGRYRVRVVGDNGAAAWLAPLGTVDGIADAMVDGAQLMFRVTGEADRVVPAVVKALVHAGAAVASVQPQEGDLRALYRRIVQEGTISPEPAVKERP